MLLARCQPDTTRFDARVDEAAVDAPDAAAPEDTTRLDAAPDVAPADALVALDAGARDAAVDAGPPRDDGPLAPPGVLTYREDIHPMSLVKDHPGVRGVDILGPSVDVLAGLAGVEARGIAGAIRQPDEAYFDRIDAMEFAIKHDDGRNPEGLKDADVVLIGVSRTSKTPLSIYLASKGLYAANIPLVRQRTA